MPVTKQDFIESLLNEIEKAEVIRIVENPTAFEAFKKVLLASAYFNGTLRAGVEPNATYNAAFGFVNSPEGQTATNEQIGADLRSLYEAVRMVEAGFAQLSKLKTPQQKPAGKKANPAT